MYKLIIFLLSFSFLNLFPEYNRVNNIDLDNSIKVTNCDSLMKIASKIYKTKNFDTIQPLFLNAAKCYLANNNYKSASYCYLNLATWIDENSSNKDLAISYLNYSKSINLDTMHQANLNKLLGLIYYKINQNTEGDFYFDLAIYQYNKINFIPGLNVAYSNLAVSKYLAGELDKSFHYYKLSNTYYKNGYSSDRLFVSNILGINLCKSLNRKQELDEAIYINDSLLIKNQIKVNQVLIDSFYIMKVKYK